MMMVNLINSNQITSSGTFKTGADPVKNSNGSDGGTKQPYQSPISEETVKKAVDRVNKTIIKEPRQAEFSVNKTHGDIIIKIINPETKEVIREIPPEKFLDMMDKLEEIISGAIIDEKR